MNTASIARLLSSGQVLWQLAFPPARRGASTRPCCATPHAALYFSIKSNTQDSLSLFALLDQPTFYTSADKVNSMQIAVWTCGTDKAGYTLDAVYHIRRCRIRRSPLFAADARNMTQHHGTTTSFCWCTLPGGLLPIKPGGAMSALLAAMFSQLPLNKFCTVCAQVDVSDLEQVDGCPGKYTKGLEQVRAFVYL